MHALSIVFWAVTSLTGSTLGAGAQQLLATTPGVVGRQSGAGVESKRNLQGRFLHITDLHPDPFYKLHSSTAKGDACHRGSGPAGTYGAETSDCDSPISLINATFDWIDANLKDTIDFVIWTGDSARHDNDEEIPRTVKQVLDLNQMLVDRFVDVFSIQGSNETDSTNDLTIPIIPTFGNNDILPHNIMTGGPNEYTKQYLKIWKKFIPEAQRHGFERGGWFFVEAIPDKLAVLSLNTLYFFDSNSAVDGCADKSQPGFEHMEWLRIQLEFIRERGMKAILMGHVPPARTSSKMSWDETCWQKYALWMHQFRDVVIGSIYGHMNLDHFMLQDSKDIDIESFLTGEDETGNLRSYLDSGFSLTSAEDYLTDLREDWSNLPEPPWSPSAWPLATLNDSPLSQNERYWDIFANFFRSKKSKNDESKWGKHEEEKFFKKIGGKWAERFSMSLVSPSVVPNYYPTLRVISYNISGIEDPPVVPDMSSIPQTTLEGPWIDQEVDLDFGEEKKNKKKKNKKHPKKPSITIPKPPPKSAPPGPAYSSQTLSWLGYVQYYANLTTINNDLQGLPIPNTSLAVEALSERSTNITRWHPGKHSGKEPHKRNPTPDTKKFVYEVEYSTFNDSIFTLPDLTIRNFLELARRIGQYHPDKADQMPSPLGSSCPETLEEDSRMNMTKKRKKHKNRHAKNKAWFTFVKRAFVGTIDDEDLHQRYGQEIIEDGEECLHLS